MTVKVVLLKSGEDVIADVEEMVVGEKVVGYFFNYPLSVKLQGNEAVKDRKQHPFKLRLTPHHLQRNNTFCGGLGCQYWNPLMTS